MVTKRQEATQEMQGKEACPYLLHCRVLLTNYFFNRICNSPSYPNCHHFARRIKELRAPLAWLQKLAVHEGRQTARLVGKKALPKKTGR